MVTQLICLYDSIFEFCIVYGKRWMAFIVYVFIKIVIVFLRSVSKAALQNRSLILWSLHWMTSGNLGTIEYSIYWWSPFIFSTFFFFGVNHA